MTATRNDHPVRPATLADQALLMTIAAEGFYDDPVMRWVLRDDDRRLGQLGSMFGSLVRDALPDRGHVHLADEASAALWRDADFDHHPPAAPDGEAAGDPYFEVDRFRPDELERLGILDAAMQAAHPHGRHWYLNIVSTRPDRQGQGLGAAVLAPVLQRCDEAGERAYLESTNPRNRTLYRRLGFVDGDEIAVGDGPTMLQMWRDPRPA